MERLRRVYRLQQVLASRHTPASLETLQEKLGCSRATINRIIRDMRLYFNAPLEYDRERNGYRYDLKDGATFELPGLWLSVTDMMRPRNDQEEML